MRVRKFGGEEMLIGNPGTCTPTEPVIFPAPPPGGGRGRGGKGGGGCGGGWCIAAHQWHRRVPFCVRRR